MELVRDVIEWHSPEVNTCFTGAGKRPSVRYHFEVRPEGTVTRLALLDAKGAEGPRVTCVATALEKWHFPAADAGTAIEWAFSAAAFDAGVGAEPEVIAVDQFPVAWVDEVSRCYDALRPGQTPEGRLELQLVVTPAGAVVEASTSLASPAIAASGVPACILESARSWSMAASARPRRILLQWLFASSEGRAKLMFLPMAPVREIIANQPKVTPSRERGLERSALMVEIRKLSPRMKECYEAGLRANHALSGKLSVAFQIGADGHVLSATAAEDTLGDALTSSCMIEAVEHMRFPPPNGGGVVNVTFPWIFKPADE